MTTEATERDLVTEVEELLAKATPGPWKVYSDSRPDVFTTANVNSGYMGERHLFSMDKYGESWGQDFENEDDAALIARSPELLRRLVEEVKRLTLTEQEVKLLTDYHYYEAEKAVTRRGDKAQQQIHLERLAALRNRDHHA